MSYATPQRRTRSRASAAAQAAGTATAATPRTGSPRSGMPRYAPAPSVATPATRADAPANAGDATPAPPAPAPAPAATSAAPSGASSGSATTGPGPGAPTADFATPATSGTASADGSPNPGPAAGSGTPETRSGTSGARPAPPDRIVAGPGGRRFNCGPAPNRGKRFRFPAYFPPRLARIRDVRMPRVREAPKLDEKAAAKLRRTTGLSADEHHDRVRQMAERISHLTQRGQIDTIHYTEHRARGAKFHIEQLKWMLGETVGAAIAQVQREAARVKNQIAAYRDEMICAVDDAHFAETHDAEATRDAATNHMWELLSNGSTEILAAANALRATYGQYTDQASNQIKAVPTPTTPAFIPGLEGGGDSDAAVPEPPATLPDAQTKLLEDLDGGDDAIETWQNSQLRGLVPSLVTQYKATLQSNADKAAKRITSPTALNEFYIVALGLVSPTAREVHDDEHGAIDSAEAQADDDISSIEQSRRQTREYLRDACEGVQINIDVCLLPDLIEGLRFAGQNAMNALQAQADAADRQLRDAAGPLAHEYGGIRERFEALLPERGTLDFLKLRGPLGDLWDGAKALPTDHAQLVDDQERALIDAARRTYRDQRRAMLRAGASSAHALTDVGTQTRSDLLLTAARFAGPQLIDGNTDVVSHAREYITRTADQLVKAEAAATEGLTPMQTRAISYLNAQIGRTLSGYQQASHDMASQFEKGIFKSQRESISSDLESRAGKITDATPNPSDEEELTSMLAFGLIGSAIIYNADEDAVLQALLLPWPGPPAVKQKFEALNNGENLEQRLRDTMGSDDAEDAINLLSSDAEVRGRQKHEIVRDSVGAIDSLFGYDSATRETALQSMSAEENNSLSAEFRAETADEVSWWTFGDSERLAVAYIENRRDDALAVRFERAFAGAHDNGSRAIADATATLDQLVAAEETGSANATWVAPERLTERRLGAVRSWARMYRADDVHGEPTQEEANRLFVDHVTRDQVVHIEGEEFRTPVDPRVTTYVRTALVEGPNGPHARDQRAAFEITSAERGSEPSEDSIARINEQLDNSALYDAEMRYNRETDPGKRADLRREVDELRRRHTLRLTSLAHELGATDAELAAAGGAEAYMRNRIGTLMARANSTHGRAFGEQLVTRGRADLLTGIHMATDMTGTNEALLAHVRAHRYKSEWKEARAAYGEHGVDAYGRTLDQMLTGVRPDDMTLGHRALMGASPLVYMFVFGGEVSGDEAMATERDMLGIPETAEDWAALAALRYSQERERGTGPLGSLLMSGSESERRIDAERARLGALLLAGARESGQPVPDSAFLPDGSFNPDVWRLAFRADGSFRGDENAMRNASMRMDWAAARYQAAMARIESYLTSIVSIITTILSIVASFFGPIGMAVGLLITAIGGLVNMAIKAGMRGERYGWEEAATDGAMLIVEVAVQAATLGFGKVLGKPAAWLAKAVAAGSKAEVAIARVGGAMIREAIAGAVSNAAQVALQDETWSKGTAEGLAHVLRAGARGALVGAVTAGVSEGLDMALSRAMRQSGSKLRGLSDRLGPQVSASLREGISESIGAMAGETAGILFDVETGQYRGTFADALKSIGLAGLRDLLTGAARGAGGYHYRERYRMLMERARAGGEMSPADWKMLRFAGMAAGEISLFAPMSDVHQEVRLGRQALATLPPELRKTLAGADVATLSAIRQALAQGGFESEAVRFELMNKLRESNASFDERAFQGELDALSQRLWGRDLGVLDAEGLRRLEQDRFALPEQRQRVADDDLVGRLPDDVRRLADALIARRELDEGALEAFLRAAEHAAPDIDRAALRSQLERAVQSAQQLHLDRLTSDNKRVREETLDALPKDLRGRFAQLPDPAFDQFRQLLLRGDSGTPQERAAILRLARADNPEFDARTLLRDLDRAVAEFQTSRNAVRRQQRQERFEYLEGVPDAIRGPLSALPASALWHLQLIQLRGIQATPHQRAELLRLARQETPDIDPRTFFRALDELAARARGEVTVSDERSRAMQRQLLRFVPPELRAEIGDVPIIVMTDMRFRELTGSARGNAVTVWVDGQPRVLIREGADPRSLREEGMHLLQARDPEWQARIGALDETHISRWPELSVAEQLALYRNKLNIEVDAQQRILSALIAQASGRRGNAEVEAEIAAALRTLVELRQRQSEAGGIGRLHSFAIALGLASRPSWLDQPARLFSKDSTQPPDLPQIRRTDPAEDLPTVRHADADYHTVGFVQRGDGEVMVQLVQANRERYVEVRRPTRGASDSVDTHEGTLRLLPPATLPTKKGGGGFDATQVRGGTIVVDDAGQRWVVIKSGEHGVTGSPFWRLHRLGDPGVIEVALRAVQGEHGLPGQYLRSAPDSVTVRVQDGVLEAHQGGRWVPVDAADLQGVLVRQSNGEFQDMLVPRSALVLLLETLRGPGQAFRDDAADSLTRKPGAVLGEHRGLGAVPNENVGLAQVAQAPRLIAMIVRRLRDNEGALHMMMIRLALNPKLSPRDRTVAALASALAGVPLLRVATEALLRLFPEADKDLTGRLLRDLERDPNNDLVLGNPAFHGDRQPLLDAAPRLAEMLRDDLGLGAADAFIFNHIKSIAVGEWLMMLTASLHANDKIDAAIHVRDPELVTHFREWLGLVGQPASPENLARRRELVAAMGQRGYQVNDPLARVYNAASAINGLIFDVPPGGRVVLYVKELQDMEVARGLVAQARRGVNIDFTLYDIDPAILRYLTAELAADPTLPLTIRRATGPDDAPKFHGNLVFAEHGGNAQAFVGSNYLWFNQNVPSSPSGVSYEAGMLLQGAHARRLLADAQGARREHGLDGKVLVGPGRLENRAGEMRSVAQLEAAGLDAGVLSHVAQLRSLLGALKDSTPDFERRQFETEIAHHMQAAGLTGPDAHARFAQLRTELGDAQISTRELDSLLWRSALVQHTDDPSQRAARIVELTSRMDPSSLDAPALRSLVSFVQSQSGTGATGRRVLHDIANLTAGVAVDHLRSLVAEGVLSEPIQLVDRAGRNIEVWVSRDGTVIRAVTAGATTIHVGVLKQDRRQFGDYRDIAFEIAPDGRLTPPHDFSAPTADGWRGLSAEQRRYLTRLLLRRTGSEP